MFCVSDQLQEQNEAEEPESDGKIQKSKSRKVEISRQNHDSVLAIPVT